MSPLSTTDTVAVVLAAGKGTRMKSTLAKALFPLCGKPMVQYAVRGLRQAGIDRIVLVVGHQRDAVRQAAGDDVEWAVQEPQQGTGHALLSAESVLRGFTGTVFVTVVDMPLLPPALIRYHIDRHRQQGNAATLLTVHASDPASYGRIVRAPDGTVARIVEARDCTPAELAISEVNGGCYCFESPLIFDMLHQLKPENDQGEYYLTDVVEMLLQHGHRVGAESAPREEDVAGINDRAQLLAVEQHMREEIRRRHLGNGVSLLDPATTFIDEDVEIGMDTTIYPFTMLLNGTRIGANCTIGPGSYLTGAVIEDNVEVISSRIENSRVQADAVVGPFSRLRTGCDIGPGASIGNYSELKNTRVGARSKVHHVGYLGDTTLGEDVNIGAGTITCNFDGERKHPTQIGDGAFIGSGNLIVAPITIGQDALTGAGSVVTHDVPDNTVAFGVPARIVRERKKK